MNRKQRRAASKQMPFAASADKTSSADELFSQAAWQQNLGKRELAKKLYSRAIAVDAGHPESLNNLACLLLEDGKLREASEIFAQLLAATPELADNSQGIIASLYAVNPAFVDATTKANQADFTNAEGLFGADGVRAIMRDPLLLRVLQSMTVRDTGLEIVLTAVRADMMKSVADGNGSQHDDRLAFYCALAKQCFINEYVFTQSDDETTQVEKLRQSIQSAISSDAPLSTFELVALACYVPLCDLAGSNSLQNRTWPYPVADLITQQVAEPLEEQSLRAGIPALTEISDPVSRNVREQYEQNPYPRWVYAASARKTTELSEHLRKSFPTVPIKPFDESHGLDILIAGSGTGRHPIEVVQLYKNARVQAIDLSLASLAYAKRKTPPAFAGRLQYAQADILNLGGIGKTFDVIESSGVLHHMADPFAAWRGLLPLLRPDGVMRIGLYSELARQDIVGARKFIAQRGYSTAPRDIRRARRDLLKSEFASVARSGDFFSTSECRDLLFHVQEQRMTLPQIKQFLDAEDLRFIGFDMEPAMLAHCREVFANSGWSMTDLNRWNEFEQRHPRTFATMYQFWVQRR